MVGLWQLCTFLAIARFYNTQAKDAQYTPAQEPAGLSESHPESSSGKQLELIAQDPVFNSTDIRFLKECCGIQVLDSPAAFDLIDATAFVFAPHFSIASWSASMRNGHAALIVGNDVEGGVDRVYDANELHSVFGGMELVPDVHSKNELKAFLDAKQSSIFPEPDDDSALGALNDLRAYWSAHEKSVGT